MALIDDARTALRITTSAFDAEIADLIGAAQDDLLLSGIDAGALESPDPLVKRAILLYCKAGFGLDNPDSEKYMESFRSLETHLALSTEYQATEEAVS